MVAAKRLSLERILQSQGFGSRKEIRALIRSGIVSVAGDVCDMPDQTFDVDALCFAVEGVEYPYRYQVYLVMHKPPNYECSRCPQLYPSVLSLLPSYLLNRGVQPVGRLDADTTGLLFLSDDGQWLHTMTSPRHHVSKTYRVTTKHTVSDEAIAQLLKGVYLRDAPDECIIADACEKVGDYQLDVTIHQGKYHQVKRMIAAVGNRVEHLHRWKMGVFCLPDTLLEGQWDFVDISMISQP